MKKFITNRLQDFSLWNRCLILVYRIFRCVVDTGVVVCRYGTSLGWCKPRAEPHTAHSSATTTTFLVPVEPLKTTQVKTTRTRTKITKSNIVEVTKPSDICKMSWITTMDIVHENKLFLYKTQTWYFLSVNPDEFILLEHLRYFRMNK